MATTSPDPSATKPVAGPLFTAALDAPLTPGDRLRERRLLLALIAAYQDGGLQPSANQLAERLGIPGDRQRRIRLVDHLLDALRQDGVLVVQSFGGRERNVYELRLDARGERP